MDIYGSYCQPAGVCGIMLEISSNLDLALDTTLAYTWEQNPRL